MTVKHARKSRRKKGNYNRSGLRVRGSGNRGGVGRSGCGKRGRQKKTRYIGEQRPKGFHSIIKGPETINVGYLNEQAAKMSGKEIVFDGKVLGKGCFDKKLVVKARSFSKKAKQKIEKAGGEAVVLGQ